MHTRIRRSVCSRENRGIRSAKCRPDAAGCTAAKMQRLSAIAVLTGYCTRPSAAAIRPLYDYEQQPPLELRAAAKVPLHGCTTVAARAHRRDRALKCYFWSWIKASERSCVRPNMFGTCTVYSRQHRSFLARRLYKRWIFHARAGRSSVDGGIGMGHARLSYR